MDVGVRVPPLAPSSRQTISLLDELDTRVRLAFSGGRRVQMLLGTCYVVNVFELLYSDTEDLRR